MDRRETEHDERQLVLRAQAGDARALDAVVRLNAPLVQRLLTRILGPRQDLDDLVQITFLETLRALPGFRGQSALSTFIGGITVRVARRALRPTLLQRRSTALEAEPRGPEGPLDDRLAAREALARVRHALARVAEPKRVAFLLWCLDGMSLEEIAQVTDASVAATRSRVYYAQKELLARAAKDPWLREWLEEQHNGRH